MITDHACPKCGESASGIHPGMYQCGSVAYPSGGFDQSQQCKDRVIASLTHQLAERDADLATTLIHIKSARESAHDKTKMLVFLDAAMDRAKGGQALLDKLAERDEELRAVKADFSALVHTHLCECEYVESSECEFCAKYRANPHPGQHLLDKLARLEGAIKSIKRVNLCDGFTEDTKKHLIMALVKILDESKPERPEIAMCPKCKSTAGFSVEVSTHHNNYKTCIACRSKFPLEPKRDLTCPPLSPESAEADHAEWLKGKSSKPETKDSLKEIVEEFKCLLSNAKCELGLHQQLSRIQHRLEEILSVSFQLPLTQKGGPVMAKKPPKKPKGGKGC